VLVLESVKEVISWQTDLGGKNVIVIPMIMVIVVIHQSIYIIYHKVRFG